MFYQIIKPILFATIAVGLVAGCKKDDPEPAFVPGNIIVGFKQEVTLRQAYDFASENANGIGYVSGFFYYSKLPNDSLNFVIKSVNAGGFLEVDVRIGFISQRIEIIKNYHISDDKSAIHTWITFTEDPLLKLEDMQNYKSMLLYIPEGTEKKWLKTHVDNPLVNYIELDYYIK